MLIKIYHRGNALKCDDDDKLNMQVRTYTPTHAIKTHTYAHTYFRTSKYTYINE